ncbi:helix-turn-helix domain-containing protein [Novosphingobium sp. BL-8H]|uniref:TetR family transcriptional regulator n=1 Tax=Novosphingobium sp. BL-8H TaxID=3127640 RepID=UPI00375770AE
MSTNRSAAGRQPTVDAEAIVDAARELVAERGLAELSLRALAERAGISVGSISYRIGDRAALVEAIAAREVALAEQERSVWERSMAGVDALAAGCLADLVTAWLDDCALGGRTSAVVRAELLLKVQREPAGHPHVDRLHALLRERWRTILAEHPQADQLATRIAGYCLDERPFSILLADETDYRLLRQSTLRALLRDLHEAPASGASSWHMALVDRLATPARAAIETGEPPQGNKAAIAEKIADLILAQGIEGLSHRAVAREAATANSSVAHHFPAQRDLLLGGVEALYRRMRREIGTDEDAEAGYAVIVLTHEMALAALRDERFRPFAIDMRRRRAENVHAVISEQLIGRPDGDRAMSQAYTMAMIGHGFAIAAEPTTTLRNAPRGWRAKEILTDLANPPNAVHPS